MTLIAICLYVLGAAMAVALGIFLITVEPREKPRASVLRIHMMGVTWPLWSLIGVFIAAWWVVSYPWREKQQDKAMREAGLR